MPGGDRPTSVRSDERPDEPGPRREEPNQRPLSEKSLASALAAATRIGRTAQN